VLPSNGIDQCGPTAGEIGMRRETETKSRDLEPAARVLAEQLVAAGFKLTRPRLAVIKAIAGQAESFTVQELERRIAGMDESPGVASIFRTIRLLGDLDLVQRVHGPDDCHRYSMGAGHGHYVSCTSCGAIARFESCGVQELASRLEERTGFHIRSHLVEFFGLCPACR
jgi:Fur family ferric uptake transcriptional regulator